MPINVYHYITYNTHTHTHTQMDRDTQKCAYKCSYCVVAGAPVDVYKAPITDVGKTSKRGHLTLEKVVDDEDNVTWITHEHGKGDASKVITVTI